MKNSNRAIPASLTFSEMCKICGKSQLYVRNLQKSMGLPIPDKDSRYSTSYLYFIQKVISLRTFSVPLEDILELFAKEKSILCLLKMDALSNSPTWYLDQCAANENSDCRLLLTGYNVGFPIAGGCVQVNLDFGKREKELFNSKEMGEDVQRALASYLKLLPKIKSRIIQEKPVLEQALKWGKEAL